MAQMTTRPERRRFFGLGAAVIWLVGLTIMLPPSGETWTAAFGGYGTRVEKWGPFGYLVLIRTDVTAGGKRGPASSLSLEWRPLGVFGTITGLAAFCGAGLALYYVGVRQRPSHGRCDACGYNLRGITGTVCPECGHEIDALQRRGD